MTPPSPSFHTTPEYWTELIAARKQRRLCAEQVDAIRTSCGSRCGKTHIGECAACYGKALDRMRRRYAESGEREWFTQRKAFLQELDGLFADAASRKDGSGSASGGGSGGRGVAAIEARIESEKEAWYRWVLRRHPEFLAARGGAGGETGGAVRQDELRGMLDDPDRSREGMVGMVWQGIGEPQDWAERLERLVDKVAALTGKPPNDDDGDGDGDGDDNQDDERKKKKKRKRNNEEKEKELKKLYVREFFLDPATGEPLRNARPYVDEYEAGGAATLEEVIGRIACGSQESRRVQPQREMHRLRLDDLRRAKTAFELNKAQAKGRAKAPEVVPGEDLYDLPTCLVCGARANAGEVLSCSVCQAVTQSGGRKKLTVYCTRECYEVGHESHVEMEHDCEADGRCAQLLDEDVVMENSASSTGAFACRACFEERDSALFCSERCALENIADHRLRRHGAATTSAEEAAGLVAPLAEVVGGILQRENPGLEMRLVAE
ncbi:hypothetical protein ESCO_003290 [Escovopsis weberi]|uniref:Uncharacterized protein n=1 Tax=Escovopsis weberi TaxID=150374 RepID=A0A0M8N1Y6_ESCWE|nr:hypothetical protein ESCO_003290 [Escovopsis weberi]